MALAVKSEWQRLTGRLAYELWERRGHPIGSPEIDWFAAEKILANPQRYVGPALPLSLSTEPNEGPWF